MILYVSICQANRQNCEVLVLNLAGWVSRMGSTHLCICRGIFRGLACCTLTPIDPLWLWMVPSKGWEAREEIRAGEDLGVQAPFLRNLPSVVAIVQGHHPNSFFLQWELSAREILCIQRQTGTVEASSFYTGHVCCQCWTMPALLLTFSQFNKSSGPVRWITRWRCLSSILISWVWSPELTYTQ